MLEELKGLLKTTTLLVLIVANLTLLSFSNAKEYGVILIYHKFDEPKTPSTSIPLKDFEMQIKYLVDNNYNIVSLSKFVSYMKKGSFPDKTVAITIDDGYKSTMKAFRVLKKYNLPFTVFLYMEAVGRYPDFLTKEQIETLKKYPKVEFGNHSYAHLHFAKVKRGEDLSSYKKRFMEDTKKAERRFLELIGYRPKFYAYPYGDYNEIMASVLKDLGYKAVFAQDPTSAGVYSNLFAIPRQPVVGHWGSLKHFKKILNTKQLPVYYYRPPFGILKENPFKILAKIKSPEKFTSCGVYISEKGWLKLKKEKATLKLDKAVKLKRWKNRIGFSCYDKKEKKWATYFYMVINPN